VQSSDAPIGRRNNKLLSGWQTLQKSVTKLEDREFQTTALETAKSLAPRAALLRRTTSPMLTYFVQSPVVLSSKVIVGHTYTYDGPIALHGPLKWSVMTVLRLQSTASSLTSYVGVAALR